MEEEGKEGCPGRGTSLNRGTESQNCLGREYSETGGQKAHWETEAKNSGAKASFSGVRYGAAPGLEAPGGPQHIKGFLCRPSLFR